MLEYELNLGLAVRIIENSTLDMYSRADEVETYLLRALRRMWFNTAWKISQEIFSQFPDNYNHLFLGRLYVDLGMDDGIQLNSGYYDGNLERFPGLITASSIITTLPGAHDLYVQVLHSFKKSKIYETTENMKSLRKGQEVFAMMTRKGVMYYGRFQ